MTGDELEKMTGDELEKAIDALIAVERGEQPTAEALSSLQFVVHSFLDAKEARELTNALHKQATAIRKKCQHRNKGLVVDAKVAAYLANGESITSAVKKTASDTKASNADLGDVMRSTWRTLKDSPYNGGFPHLEQLAVTKKALEGK